MTDLIHGFREFPLSKASVRDVFYLQLDNQRLPNSVLPELLNDKNIKRIIKDIGQVKLLDSEGKKTDKDIKFVYALLAMGGSPTLLKNSLHSYKEKIVLLSRLIPQSSRPETSDKPEDPSAELKEAPAPDGQKQPASRALMAYFVENKGAGKYELKEIKPGDLSDKAGKPYKTRDELLDAIEKLDISERNEVSLSNIELLKNFDLYNPK